MSHKLHCTKSWGGTGPRELVLSAMEQATMNASGITGEGITVYRAQTTTSGQHVCFHNANNKKGYHSKHARKKEERAPRQTHRYKKRMIWFSLRYARRFGGGNSSSTKHVRTAGPQPPTLGSFTRSMNSHECVYTFMEGNKQ